MVAFGDPSRAEVATLGINPSAREFVYNVSAEVLGEGGAFFAFGGGCGSNILAASRLSRVIPQITVKSPASWKVPPTAAQTIAAVFTVAGWGSASPLVDNLLTTAAG